MSSRTGGAMRPAHDPRHSPEREICKGSLAFSTKINSQYLTADAKFSLVAEKMVVVSDRIVMVET